MIFTTHSLIVDSVHGHRDFSLEEGTESWYNGPLTTLWRELIVGNCLGDMAHGPLEVPRCCKHGSDQSGRRVT
jgi:hypothetical protein